MGAAWIRIDVGAARHPKLAALGPLAPLGYAQFVAVIAYCQEWATDGHVPVAAARTVLEWGGVSAAGEPVTGDGICEALERAGLLGACVDHPACLEIHDYLIHQQPASEIEHLREVRSAAGRRGGQHSAARRASKQTNQTAKQMLEAKRKQTDVSGGGAAQPGGAGLPGDGTLDLTGQANLSKTASKGSSNPEAKSNHQYHNHIDVPSTTYSVREAPEATETDRRDHEVVLGEVVGAPDYVAAYVRASADLGVVPIPASKARIGKAAKELAAAGKAPDLILAAIDRLVTSNRPPTALPYLVADLERERAGHGSGGRGRLSAGAQQTEEFIRRALARRQEAAS